MRRPHFPERAEPHARGQAARLGGRAGNARERYRHGGGAVKAVGQVGDGTRGALRSRCPLQTLLARVPLTALLTARAGDALAGRALRSAGAGDALTGRALRPFGAGARAMVRHAPVGTGVRG